MARQYKKNEVKIDIFSYRHYIRGEKKSGKTTLFYDLVNTLYGDAEYGLSIQIGSERGYKALDGLVYDEAPDWATLKEIVDDLVENKDDNKFKVVALDTVDELIEICKKEIVRLDYRKSEVRHEFNACFGGYGVPRQKLQTMIDGLITQIEDAGYGLVFIGHTKIKDIQEKNGDAYQMLTSNLNTDYDGIFANKADIIAMIVAEKTISDKKVEGVERYVYFRPDGYIDAGSRFPEIENKVELSAENYIDVVTNAIKSSITSRKVDDAYIEQKKKEEAQAKEDYYKNNRARIMVGDELENEIKAEENLALLKEEIKSSLSELSPTEKKAKRDALKDAGLPDKFNSINNKEMLEKILKVITE